MNSANMNSSNMTSIIMRAYAKINLSLEVIRKRPDGYHDISSFMQDLGLYDVITMGISADSIPSEMQEYHSEDCNVEGVRVQFCMNYSAISLGPDNLALRGAKAVLRALPESAAKPESIYLCIDKKLPVAAGIAGGSGNAAVSMLAMNALCGNPFSLRELMTLGAEVGADVPFSLMMNAKKNEHLLPGLPGIEEASVAAEIDGIGDIVSPAAPKPYAVILMNPGIAVSTREVYEAIDSDGDRDVVEDLFYNRMEEYTLSHYEEANTLKQEMLRHLHADYVLMSGSGPTMVAYYSSGAQAAQDYQDTLQSDWFHKKWKVWLTESGEMRNEHRLANSEASERTCISGTET